MHDDDKRPMTAAERQRAYRERKKAGQQPAKRGPGRPPKSRAQPGAVMPAPAQDHGPELPDIDDSADDDVTITRLNAYMRRCFFQAFSDVGATDYLRRVARKSPGVFLRYGQQFITREETTSPALRIVVQKLTLEGIAPVPGVIASPIAGHVAAPRLIANGGEVIDAEEVGGA